MDAKVIDEAIKMRDEFAEKLRKQIEAVEKSSKEHFTKEALLEEKKSSLSHAKERLKEAERAKVKAIEHWDARIARQKELIAKLKKEIEEDTKTTRGSEGGKGKSKGTKKKAMTKNGAGTQKKD